MILNCPCGGFGEWNRVVYLNMSDPDELCPVNWNLTSTPVRGCGRSNISGPGCDSAIFPSNGHSYSRVCGKVSAYQKGSPNAFDPSIVGFGVDDVSNPSLETVYIDGVSLTHGSEGARQHIWSFVASVREMDPAFNRVDRCSCINTGFSWPYI